VTLDELCAYLLDKQRFTFTGERSPKVLNAKETYVIARRATDAPFIYQGNRQGRFKSPRFGTIKSLALSHALGNDEWLVFYDDTDFWIISCRDWTERLHETFTCNNERYEAVKMREFQVLNKATGALRPGGLAEDGVEG
jgi:hypothetical protein